MCVYTTSSRIVLADERCRHSDQTGRQAMAAGFVRFCYISQRSILHWLPIDSRIQYKLASLYHSSLNSTAPVCLTELKIYKPTRQLHSSSDSSILCLPAVCTHSFGQRSFSYSAPSVWSSLPCKLDHQTHSHLLNYL